MQQIPSFSDNVIIFQFIIDSIAYVLIRTRRNQAGLTSHDNKIMFIRYFNRSYLRFRYHDIGIATEFGQFGFNITKGSTDLIENENLNLGGGTTESRPGSTRNGI